MTPTYLKIALAPLLPCLLACLHARLLTCNIQKAWNQKV